MPTIQRHSPPIRGRARLLRIVHPTIPRALLTPQGLHLSWQIVRGWRSVELRRCRPHVSGPAMTPTPDTRTLTLPDGRTITTPDGMTVVIASADGQTLDLPPRSGMAIDRAYCTIIDDPAPRPTPPPVSTWSEPMRTSQRASEERKPGAQERAYWKRVRRRMRNLCDRERDIGVQRLLQAALRGGK